MRVKGLFVVLTMLCAASLLLPESGMSMNPYDTDTVGWKPHPEVSFRSIQIDASTLIFWYALSGSCDVDMIALSPHKHAAIGMRFGAERMGRSGAGGDRRDYYDLNCLVRLTAASERGRIDLTTGLAFRSQNRFSLAESAEPTLKLVLEGRLNILSNWVGVFAKASATHETIMVGIGGFISWDSVP